MVPKRLFYQLIPSYLGLLLVALCLVSWLTLSEVKSFFNAQSHSWLSRMLVLVEQQLEPDFTEGRETYLNEACRQISESTGVRVTVILPNGTVTADSHKNPEFLDNHLNRDEVTQALESGSGFSTRYSVSLDQSFAYAARIRQAPDGSLAGILRVSIPAAEIEQLHAALIYKTAGYGFLVALAATVMCLVFAHYITRPLAEMSRLAREFAAGDLDKRIHPQGPEEFITLGQTLNAMAERLRNQITLLEDQRRQEKAVLSNMAEGVVAIDRNEKIFLMNRAATLYLRSGSDFTGKHLLEAIPEPELHAFMTDLLAHPESSSPTYMELETDNGKLLEIQGTIIQNEARKPVGVLAVFRDISEVRRLENVRKDFVANVSHELKTPITTIKGFIETLLAEGLSDKKSAKHFLKIIHKNTDRLTTIINDLLSLSYLEQSNQRQPPMTHLELAPVIETAIENSRPLAEKRKIRFKTNLDSSLTAIINENLLTQALGNLVDNAIKYSPEKTDVCITCRRDNGHAIIEIQDHGMGIESQHLERLFERFYRIDKARSREVGGTGLGLSIVKHIAAVHYGQVSVESEPGKGSTFRIHLPLADAV